MVVREMPASLYIVPYGMSSGLYLYSMETWIDELEDVKDGICIEGVNAF